MIHFKKIIIILILFSLAACSFSKNNNASPSAPLSNKSKAEIDLLNSKIASDDADKVHEAISSNKNLLNMIDSKGMLPLDVAISRGQINIINDLLAQNASIFVKSISNLSPYERRSSFSKQVKSIIENSAKNLFHSNMKAILSGDTFNRDLPCSVFFENYIGLSSNKREEYPLKSIISIQDSHSCINDLNLSTTQDLFFKELYFQRQNLVRSTELLRFLKTVAANSKLLFKIEIPQGTIALTPRAFILQIVTFSKNNLLKIPGDLSSIIGEDDLVAEIYSKDGLLQRSIKSNEIFNSSDSLLIYELPTSSISNLLKSSFDSEQPFWPMFALENPNCSKLSKFILFDGQLHNPVSVSEICLNDNALENFTCSDDRLSEIQSHIEEQLFSGAFASKFNLNSNQKLLITNYLSFTAMRISLAGVLTPTSAVLHSVYRNQSVTDEKKFLRDVFAGMMLFPSQANKERRSETANYINDFVKITNENLASCMGNR